MAKFLKKLFFPSEARNIRSTIFFLFFASGASGLIYEVVWARMLNLTFGATVTATTIVLSSFMTGLAVGSLYFGKLIDKNKKNPLKVYVYLQIGTGTFALLIPYIFMGLEEAYVFIYRTYHPDFLLLNILRFCLSFLVLIFPSTLMGGTFPIISKYLVRKFEKLGRDVGLLYFVNTLGGAVGCFTTGFFLIQVLGMTNSIYLAAGINFAVAGTILLISPGLAGSKLDEIPQGHRFQKERKLYPRNLARLTVGIFAVSGFCALSYEVLWARVLVFFLGNTTYAFSTMLTTFLCGIALGSLIFAKFVDSRKSLLWLLGLVEISIGIWGALTIFLFGGLDLLVEGICVTFGELTWGKIIGARFISSFAVMFVPTFLMGAALPIVLRIYTLSWERLGRSVGGAYSANTLGSISGSIFAGLLLVPLMGIQISILLVTLINVTVGVVAVILDPIARGRIKWASLAAGICIMLLLSTTVLLYKGGLFLNAILRLLGTGERIIYYREGIGDTVAITWERKEKVKKLFINREAQGDSSFIGMRVERRQGYLPLLLCQAQNPKDVLVIGLGTGITLNAIAQGSRQVDCVEIIPEVIEAARHFSEENNDVLNNPKVNVIVEDGKGFVRLTDKKYDLIINDIIYPDNAGAGNLYSENYYRLCRGKLKQFGMMIQWIPLFQLSEYEFKIIIRTFLKIFPYTTLWFACIDSFRPVAALVGNLGKPLIDYHTLNEKFEEDELTASLEEVGFGQPTQFLSYFIMDEENLCKYAGQGPINTEIHPYIEFLAPKSPSTQVGMQNLVSIAQRRQTIFPLLTNIEVTQQNLVKEELKIRFEAIEHLIRGRIYSFQEKTENEIDEYRTALQLIPQDQDTEYFLQFAEFNYYLNQGDKLRQAKKYREAIIAYIEAIQRDSNSALAHNNLGVTYANMGKFEEAFYELKKALELDPESPQALLNLQLLYEILNCKTKR